MSDNRTCLWPAGCQWDIYFADRRFPEEMRELCVKGFDALKVREKLRDCLWTFSVCRICGSISYYNPNMGKAFICKAVPVEEDLHEGE